MSREKSRWDERCPHCEQKIHIAEMWQRHGDYSTDWQVDCPKCGKVIQVDVHSVPEFELSKGANV
jgi:endogenous inhibitor of DNA gyrase (YacG/DUF329 family)